uniref:NADH dehydrogenase [ubiquinone] iron-sulfur protein 5 n=1 Tax=Trichuris muris TaxID=70415 RepID=A0A5S6QK42_TRIMR
MSTATPGRPGTIGPLVSGPLQDIFARLLTMQGTPCENFELNYMRCVEAYGHMLAKRYCDLELRDFYECCYQTKREKRIQKIRDERMRQFLNAERDRPFEDRKIPFHASSEDYFSHNRVW